MTRFGYVMVTYFTTMGVVIASFVPVPVKLVWNASASAPIGLYEIEPAHHPAVTDLLAVRPPKPLADFMVERGYIGQGVPLMKRVMALPGQEVCRTGLHISVDGVPLGDALDRDRKGRPLPVWQGCRRIERGDLFLMNPDVRDSLDGRYFGPIPARGVIGRAIPLYTDEAGDGRFIWRAAVAVATPASSLTTASSRRTSCP
ncbi:conjugative transfer signal peptidase TraF [Sphingomonas sp. BE270]|jgi:conjugative transfer signal peptidase TraF|uniref:S26 family signal peptidase n=1 Tax=Sphingobium yanoikuyae TaxID=13690 RepID=A0A9X7UFM6_SPHYA|nr:MULTISPECIES: S26 family signal peptidase [Alphaproteobacteria]MBY0140063.1 S26 family signal peptidase [Methylorubrum populi]MCH4021902.1 S26 family signal peptidase [Acetobacter sp.]MBK3405202.1 S26 family signal peptidase [Methylorubrum rhodesianum]MCH4061539.1 S26 family signal peptidase [Acetobacter sp.]MDR7260221.1 conjugative transfer signal peptidase TraF [Sphingomonas sp. BE270]